MAKKKTNGGASLGFEDKMWAAADKLRGHMDSPHLKSLTEYDGRYSDRVNPLYEYIIYSLLGGNDGQAAQVQNLTFTLLNGMEDLAVVDWSTRSSTQSAVRIFVKKLIALFAIEAFAPDAIKDVVLWLSKNIPGGDA